MIWLGDSSVDFVCSEYIYIYIYIERERERERQTDKERKKERKCIKIYLIQKYLSKRIFSTDADECNPITITKLN